MTYRESRPYDWEAEGDFAQLPIKPGQYELVAVFADEVRRAAKVTSDQNEWVEEVTEQLGQEYDKRKIDISNPQIWLGCLGTMYSFNDYVDAELFVHGPMSQQAADRYYANEKVFLRAFALLAPQDLRTQFDF